MPFSREYGGPNVGILGTSIATGEIDDSAVTLAKLSDKRIQMLVKNSGVQAAANVTSNFDFNSQFNNVDGGYSLTSGSMELAKIPVFEGQVITKVCFYSGDTALVKGATPHLWGALFESAVATTPYDFLFQSADDTNATWGADTKKSFTLTAAHTVTAAQALVGYLYGGVMQSGGAGVTMVKLRYFGNLAYLTSAITPHSGGVSTTGLTTTAPDPAAAPTSYRTPCCSFE